MAKPKLQIRLPSLDGLPEHIASLYDADPKRGGFVLNLAGEPPATEPLAPLAGDLPPKPSAKKAAEAHRDQLVASAIERMGIVPNAVEAAQHALRKLIHVEEVDGGLVVECFHPSGYRWPSSLVGKSWADYEEFVQRVAGNAEVVKPDWLLPAPPPPKTAEQAARDDSEVLPRAPKNVRLPHGYSQADFERAFQLAQQRGGQVIFDEPPAEKPTRRFQPGKDIQVRHNEFDGPDGQQRFEQMHKLARQQGGEIVFLPPPAGAADGVDDPRSGDQRRFESDLNRQLAQGG